MYVHVPYGVKHLSFSFLPKVRQSPGEVTGEAGPESQRSHVVTRSAMSPLHKDAASSADLEALKFLLGSVNEPVISSHNLFLAPSDEPPPKPKTEGWQKRNCPKSQMLALVRLFLLLYQSAKWMEVLSTVDDGTQREEELE